MTIDFRVPELGENIESGDIVNVLVREGQTVETNQPVVELETDKAVVELPSPSAGRVAKVAVKKGDTVRVGQTLLVIEAEAATPAAVAKSLPLLPGEGRGEGGSQPVGPSKPTAPSPPAPLPQAGEGSFGAAPLPRRERGDRNTSGNSASQSKALMR